MSLPHSTASQRLKKDSKSKWSFKKLIVVGVRLVLAEEHGREGLNMRTRLFPEHHLTIGLSLTTVASIFLERNKLKEAEQAIRRAISIRQ